MGLIVGQCSRYFLVLHNVLNKWNGKLDKAMHCILNLIDGVR